MKNYPILILAYRRTKELLAVLESVKQLSPSKIYFHIHDAPNFDQQKEVNEVKGVISDYSGPKEVLYSQEPLGVRNSMKSALAWISGLEEQFYVFEDDIILKPGSAKRLIPAMKSLEKTGGILKFGEHREYAVYWGWATTAETAKKLVDCNIQDIPYETMQPHFESKIHYRGIMEMYRRGQHQAWDDEFGMITKVLGINEIKTEAQLTDHIGKLSTRTSNGIDKNFGEGSHVMFKNGVLISE